MRAKLLLPLMLISTGPTGLALPPGQEGDVPAESASGPRSLVVWLGTVAEDQVALARESLAEFAEHLRGAYPEVSCSIYETHVMESEDRLLVLIETADPRALSDFYRRAGRDRRYGELRAERSRFLIGDSRTNLVLRQIAGPPSKAGEPWAQGLLLERSVRARFGKIGTALAAARAITDHMNRHVSGTRTRAYVEALGNATTIHWFVEVPSGDAWDMAEGKLHEDPAYLELLDGAADAFVDGSFRDVLFSLVH